MLPLRRHMKILMELSPQKLFKLLSARIELHPLLIEALRNPLRVNTRLMQPLSNAICGMLARCKDIVDLLGSVVMAVLRRVGIRYLHKQIMAAIQILLAHANADWQELMVRDFIALDPVYRQDLALLVQSVSRRIRR